MKYLLIIMSLYMSGIGEAHAETTPVPINVLEWFDGCAQLTQPSNGMVMDINCADLAIEYCTTGRVNDKRLQCLADFSEHMVSLSAAIKTFCLKASRVRLGPHAAMSANTYSWLKTFLMFAMRLPLKKSHQICGATSI